MSLTARLEVVTDASAPCLTDGSLHADVFSRQVDGTDGGLTRAHRGGGRGGRGGGQFNGIIESEVFQLDQLGL